VLVGWGGLLLIGLFVIMYYSISGFPKETGQEGGQEKRKQKQKRGKREEREKKHLLSNSAKAFRHASS
jgi:hypothetical protein